MTVLRIGLGGALGRMGQALAEVLAGRADAKLVAIYDRPDVVGQALGGLTLAEASAALPACDVAIDFSTPAASVAVAKLAAAAGRPALVIGATGWTEAEEAAVADAARRAPIVKSGNYSLGVNVLAGLVEQAARRLPAADWDIEIAEVHHRRKVDAPSGTALMLGEAAAVGRGVGLGQVRVRARDGITGPRPQGAIGFSSLRAGGVVGDHSVMFASEEEVLSLGHSARDRKLFARGAVAAALWVADKPPGLYDMKDVLGFRDA
ncbi:MAG TPA: 4-hydroxy-tetrahydrodipicolinate reductase [Caulobacteraceae bacterium]|nr:4-hydroxy-tetrahydrodipicolinate reductase [Caulobacteraceae bacterium]